MANGLTILGVPIDNVSMEETLGKIEEFIHDGTFHQIATANVDYLVNAVANREYKEVLCRCDLVVADGMPVVLASRMLGSPLRERVAGADLVPRLARLSGREGHGIFLLGAAPEVSKAAGLRLEDMGARIVGRLSPPICPLPEFDNDSILAEIEKANPDILLVAFGSPKQEMWIHQVRHRLKVPVCIGVGGSLDFLAGAVPRAPDWVQKASLEWVYRMWAEPRRLAGRYLKDALWMARYFTLQLALSVAMRRSGRALQISVDSIGSVNILTLSGMMSGPRLAQLEHAAFSVAERGGPLVVDLTGVSYLGADGVRTLAGLLRTASSRKCQLSLAGVSPALARTLKASCCEGLFREVPSVLDAVRQASRGRLQLSLELGEGWAVCRIGGEIPRGARGTLEKICRQVIETNEFFEFDGSGVPEFDASGLLEPARPTCRLVLGDRAQRPVAEIAVS
jgi:N-acetylglucosaminyldiphosphoundecaprenol N-acetyl-beta-D-mannosaminyltransferase